MKQLFAIIVCLLTLTAANAQDKGAKNAKPATTKEVKKDATPVTVGTPAAAPTGAEKKDNPNAAKIIFKEEAYEFGELPEGPQATHEFKFTNTGKEPLILSNVKASCGCTTPSWPKEPILPGKDGTILVTYNTQGRIGNFTKTITISSNSDQPNKVITIKGEVVKADPEKSVPVEPQSILTPKN